jgi:hypothetical protein
MNLFKALIISCITGYSLPFLNESSDSYQAKCLFMAGAFLFMAGYCYYFFLKQLKLKPSTDVYIVAALCFCMVISSWFNFIFVHPDVYHLLLDARRGDGISWKNIYMSVEILALLTVGKNGTINIYNWFICRSSRHSVIIKHNSTYNTGI